MRSIVAVLLAVGLPMSTHAQQPAPSTYAPVATPEINPDMLKTPQAAPPSEPKKLKANSDKDAPALTAPNSIEIGKSKLDIDVKNSGAASRGLVPDSGETSNLKTAVPGQKQDPTLPDYFGLKITTPTR